MDERNTDFGDAFEVFAFLPPWGKTGQMVKGTVGMGIEVGLLVRNKKKVSHTVEVFFHESKEI